MEEGDEEFVVKVSQSGTPLLHCRNAMTWDMHKW